MELEQVDW